jgi:hypothetical protein
VLEYIIALSDSVTVAEVLKLRVRETFLKFFSEIQSDIRESDIRISLLILLRNSARARFKCENFLEKHDLGKVHDLCFDVKHFHKKEVDERKSNEKRAKALKTVRKSNDKRAKDLATLLPTQDRNLRSRGAKPTHKGGGPIKQPGGGFRGN